MDAYKVKRMVKEVGMVPAGHKWFATHTDYKPGTYIATDIMPEIFEIYHVNAADPFVPLKTDKGWKCNVVEVEDVVYSV